MSQIQETKILIGSMDKESSPETVSTYDYIDARNIRSTGNEGGDRGYVTNLEGNSPIDTQPNSGINKDIGSQGFDSIGKAYYVRWNSEGRHRIIELDSELSSETVIFENITDSDNIDIWNLTEDSYIADIRIINDIYLLINDDEGEIICINTEYFKNNRGVVPFVQEDLYLIKVPPVLPPRFSYINDTSITNNALRGNLFQFRSSYVYRDFQESSWSPVSARTVPSEEQSDGYGQDSQKGNAIIVTVPIENIRAERLTVAVRTGLGNWLLLKDETIDYILSLPNTEVTPTLNQESYDPSTMEYNFIFRNDGAYSVLDQVDVESLYDRVPKKSEALGIVNGNVVALGGITEGYDRPENISLNLSVSTYDPQIGSTTEGGGDFTSGNITTIENRRLVGSGGNYNNYRVVFTGTPKAGDVITIETRKQYNDITQDFWQYTVTPQNEVGGLENTLQSLAQEVRGGYYRQNFPGNQWQLGFLSNEYDYDDRGEIEVIKSISVRHADIGTLMTRSLPILKSGSAYQTAVAFYDKFGRAFPIVTNSEFRVSTPSATSVMQLPPNASPWYEYNVPQIDWEISGTPPEWADSYSILISENQTHLNSITLTGSYESGLSNSRVITFKMKSLDRIFQEENSTNLGYSFTQGDRVTLISSTFQSSTALHRQAIRNPFIDLDIVDFTTEVSPTDPNNVSYYLKVRRSSLLTETILQTGGQPKEILMEIYTPKKKDVDTSSVIFYETGQTYKIENGDYSVNNGTIREGDWYIRGRMFESTFDQNQSVVYAVEDPNFSDWYESRYWNAGRARTYYDETGEVFRRGSIRYSDEFIVGSRYSGINKFYVERIYGEIGGQTTSKFGTIKKLEDRDSSMVCIQESKIGIIPVYRSIIQDNTDTSLVVDSGKIFGNVQYRNGEYGCGDAKNSIVKSKDGVIYLFDSNSSVPLRDSLSGLDVIDRNMTNYFIQANDGYNGRILGNYDTHNREYNLTLSDTITWSERRSGQISGWSSFKDFIPNTGFSLFNNLYTSNNGVMYIHSDSSPRNNFYGIQYGSSIKFLVSSQGVKTYNSIAVHSNKLLGTTPDGIQTELGNVSELIGYDFTEREGIYYANFLRDIIMDDRLKGRYIIIELTEEEDQNLPLRLFKVVIKSNISTVNE